MQRNRRYVSIWSVTVALCLTGAASGAVDRRLGCADVNGDSTVDLGDGVAILSWLFLRGTDPTCEASVADCGDINGDGVIDLTDSVHLLQWLFLGGSAPECSGTGGVLAGFYPTGDNAWGYAEYIHDATGLVFVLLPGGKFLMGSPSEECQRFDEEGPQHEVWLSPFLIAKYEVSQADWERIMGRNPSSFDGMHDSLGRVLESPLNRGELPVEHLEWEDVLDFVVQTGLGPPSEAEWEYACRASSSAPFAVGDGRCIEPDHANFRGDIPYCAEVCSLGEVLETTVPVQWLEPNAFGLHHMHGNVWEWCEDIYDPDFYSRPESNGLDPVCRSGFSQHVVRGGSWDYPGEFCRSSFRLWGDPSLKLSIGLRPCISLGSR